MIHSIARLGLLGMVALAVLLPIRSASAQQDNWVDGTGNWSTPGNWNAGVPGSGANVNIVDSDNVSRTITYDYTGPAVTLSYLDIVLSGGSGSATNTLSMSANNLTVSGSEQVGVFGTGTFTQTGGTNTITGSGYEALAVGANSGSNGSYMRVASGGNHKGSHR